MRRRLITSIVFLLVLPGGVLTALQARSFDGRLKTETSDISLPSFQMEDDQGNIVNLQQLKGKVVFVNLWATWCPPCRREIPSIQRLSKTVDSTKVAFVMLSLDNRFVKAQNYMRRKKIGLPAYYPAEGLPALFKVEGIPATFIFNRKGILIKAVLGGDEYDTQTYTTLLKNG